MNNIQGYPDTVEILTKSGFKAFNKLTSRDLILQVNNRTLVGKYTEFELFKSYYKGDLISINTTKYNIIGTPDTEINITPDIQQRRGLKRIPLKSKIPAHNIIPYTCTTNSKLNTNDLFETNNAELTLAAILIQNTHKLLEYNLDKNEITLICEVTSINNLLRRTLTYLQIQNKEEQRINKSLSNYSIFRFKLPEKLKCIVNKQNKFTLPRDWLNTLELDLKKHLVKTFAKFSNENNVIISSNISLLKQLQELACTSNIGTYFVESINEDYYKMYASSSLLYSITRFINDDKNKSEYKGYIYNVKIPSGTVVLRYNNTVSLGTSLL